jgi:mannose-6-phosphate isomerase-like protein (cupin superfamily)
LPEHQPVPPGTGSVLVLNGWEHGLSGVSLMLADINPGHGAGLHRHPYDEVFSIHEGEAEFIVGGQPISASAGDVVIVPAWENHSFTNTGAGQLRHTTVHVAGEIKGLAPDE